MNNANEIINHAKSEMDKACDSLKKALARIRAGRAVPEILDSVLVSNYGNMVNISHIASINIPDARTITIKPWDKKMISEIEQAISHSKVGLVPTNNGEMIIIKLPPMTEERRKILVKQVKEDGEHSKVVVRNIRKACKETLSDLENISEDEVKIMEKQLQEVTNNYISKVDSIMGDKETDLMTV